MWVGASDAFGEHEGHMFVEADGTGGEMAVLETSTEESERAFVFLPWEDVAIICDWAGGEKFAGAAFFEGGADEERFGSRWKDEGPQAFATVQMQVCEVNGGTGGVGEDDGIDSVLDHQLVGTLDADVAFDIGEGAGLASEIWEGLDCRGSVRGWDGLRRQSRGGERDSGSAEAVAAR